MYAVGTGAAVLGFLLVLAARGDGLPAWIGGVLGIAGALWIFEAAVVRRAFVHGPGLLNTLAPLAVLGLAAESVLYFLFLP